MLLYIYIHKKQLNDIESMNKQKLKNIIPLTVFIVLLGLVSCQQDIESVAINEPGIENQNPTAYQAYLQQLMQYKKSKHKVVFGWFDNSVKKPASQGQLLSAVPDSIDYLVLTHPDSLTQTEQMLMNENKRKRGIESLFEINFKTIADRYDAEKQTFEEKEENKGKKFSIDFNTYLVSKVATLLLLADKYNYDGIVVAFSAQMPLYMTPQEQNRFLSIENDVLGMAKDWKERHPNKKLILAGMPQYIKDKTLLQQIAYIIIPCEQITNEGAMKYILNKAIAEEGVPTDKFVPMVEMTSIDKADTKTGYWTKQEAVIGCAHVVAAQHNNYNIAGVAIKNMNNDYYHSNFVYPLVRQTISIVNPTVKK